ncbi:MAG: hypothetical protein D6714_00495 [Bacteroidetes bacterium]|nr:MAG: hypothetical protein D6714_00495 [Bacteroidota bacterium]
MKRLSILFFALFLLHSCQKDESVPVAGDVEYVIFGHFYGECVGEACIEIFKIENGVLYEDTKDNYPSFSDPYVGEYVALDDAKYQQVKDLPSKIPAELFNETQTVIGQPDAGDWGGYYFEVKEEGVVYHYLIDKATSNLPDYLKPFADVLEEYIARAQG